MFIPNIAKAQETNSFVSKEGSFSIDFPDKPKKSENELNGPTKGKLYSFAANKNNISFFLTYTEYESLDPKISTNKEAFIFSIAGGYLESTKGDLIGAIKTKFNSFSGRSIKIRTNDKFIFYRVYYVDDKKDTIYHISVFVDKKDVANNEETILNFLNSFKLLDSQGLTIVNKQNNLLNNPDPSSPKVLTSDTIVNNITTSSNTDITTNNNTDNTTTTKPDVGSVPSSDGVLSAAAQGIKPPQILQKTKPKYTDKARENSVEGIVILSAVFRRNGAITDVKVVNGLGYGLDEEAIRAAFLIKFIPGQKEGKAVNVRARLEYTFSLLK